MVDLPSFNKEPASVLTADQMKCLLELAKEESFAYLSYWACVKENCSTWIDQQSIEITLKAYSHHLPGVGEEAAKMMNMIFQ